MNRFIKNSIAMIICWLTVSMLLDSSRFGSATSPEVLALPTAGALSQQERSTPDTSKLPDDAQGWVALGDRRMQQARSTQAESDYQRAEAAYGRALELNPADAAAMTGIAWVHGVRHEFIQSIEWARKSVDLLPVNADAYGIWGDALVELGDYDGAFEKYQRMLDLKPDLASYSRGAHLLFLTGEQEKATLMMQRAISAGGPHWENISWCRAQLALMWLNQGKYFRAEELMKRALAQSPRNYDLLIAMARVQTALGDFKNAIAGYEQATTVVPNPAVIAELGDLYLLEGRTRDAKRQFSLAEEIWRRRDRSGAQKDIQRPRFYADHDRNLKQALAEAQAIYQRHKNILAADTLAWCYFKTDRLSKARSTIGQALRFDTPDARILFHAGMIHARLGDRSKAAGYLQKALDLNPGFHPVFARQAVETLNQLKSEG